MFNAVLGSRKTWRLLQCPAKSGTGGPLHGRATHASPGTVRYRAGKVDPDHEADDLLRRDFAADRPNQRWAADFT